MTSSGFSSRAVQELLYASAPRTLPPDAAYVEFTGVFIHHRDEKPFPFRVVFGSVTRGEGTLVPATREREAPLMSKRVVLGTLTNPATVTTALYFAEEDVRKLQ